MQIKEFLGNPDVATRLFDFLLSVNQEFIPPISSNEPLREYIDHRHSHILYLEDQEEIVGYLRFMLDFPKYECPYIKNLAVAKAYRGKGYGRLLITSCLERIKIYNFSRAVLTTWSTNDTGIALYKKLNFKVKEVVKNARGEGVDTYLFEVRV